MVKKKINKNGIVNTSNFFCKNGIPRKSSDLVILGIEKNKYEILKRKTERLIRILDRL